MKSIGSIRPFTRNRISSNIKFLWNQIYLKLTELSRTVLKYAFLENIRPIWVQIFSIEFNKFFVQIFSMSYRYRIVSIRTTSLRVELNDYRSYLVDSDKSTNLPLCGTRLGSKICRTEHCCFQTLCLLPSMIEVLYSLRDAWTWIKLKGF